MYQQPSAESLRFLYDEPSETEGPLNRAEEELRREREEQLSRELSGETADAISVKVGQRGAMLDYQRRRAESGELAA